MTRRDPHARPHDAQPWLPLALLLAACVGDKPASDDSEAPDDSAAPDSEPGDSDTGAATDCDDFALLEVSSAVADHGDAAQAGGIAALLATVPPGCEVMLHLVAPGPYTVSTALELPSWSTIRVDEGAWLDGAAPLTVNGGIVADRWRIFAGEGPLDGEPRISGAQPEWFGAVIDDGGDDAAAIQAALDFFPSVALDAGVYDLASTVRLDSGARLMGPASESPLATLRTTLIYPETEGYYPTRLLEATAASDLEIHDVILDGDRHARLEECWSYPETDNLARFEQVTGLTLKGVTITGWEANWGAEDWTLAHVVAVLDSQGITLTDVSLLDSRTEGLLILDSSSLTIQGLYTQNTDVWTPLSVFYVEDVTFTDSVIIEDEETEWTGSTVNLSVSDAVVADNEFIGGWGLDFGDETGTTPWGPANIVIEDNTIETVGQGIYFSPYAAGDRVSDVTIRGNDLTLHRSESASDTNQLIRMDAAAHVTIEDNTLTVPDGGVALARGVSFTGSTEDITVQGNVMTGVDVGVSHSGDVADGGDLAILDNTITCDSEIRLDTWNGGSTGVWIFRYVAAHFDSVRVEGNEIEAVGGWVSLIDYATLYTDPEPFVDSLTVIGNAFGPEEGSERGLSADAADDVTIEDNTPEWINP